MKAHICIALLVGALTSLAAIHSAAQDKNKASDKSAGASSAKSDLRALISKVQAKLKEDKRTEHDLAPELKEFDALLEKYKAEKTDDVAQILFMKAMLYHQVLDDTEQAMVLVQKLQKEFPNTEQGKKAEQLAGSLKGQAAARQLQKSLVAGAKFPDFQEKDLDGKPLSIAAHKGKLVLVDFWATWCGPCVGELPNVLKTYQKYHGKGFEIVGISLDKDKQKLQSFMKEKGMKWAQYFDGQGWQNKLAGKYGVDSIPATFLLDGNGVIIARDLRGEALEEAVAKGLKN